MANLSEIFCSRLTVLYVANPVTRSYSTIRIFHNPYLINFFGHQLLEGEGCHHQQGCQAGQELQGAGELQLQQK